MAEDFEDRADTPRFPTTSWTLILTARQPESEASREALERLCRSYWYPIYAFMRRKGLDPEQARDSTQEFFASLIEKEYLGQVERARGRFRSFLLVSAGHFLSNWFDSQRALKRGGGRQLISLEMEGAEGIYQRQLSHALTPEALFEYHWATQVVARALTRLCETYTGKHLNSLEPFLLGEAERGDIAAVADHLGLSESAFKVTVHRLRKRYRELLRAEIAETVVNPSQVDDEIRYLLKALSRCDGNAL